MDEADKKTGAGVTGSENDLLLPLRQRLHRFPIGFILGLFFLRRRAWRSHPTVRTERPIAGCCRRVNEMTGGAVVYVVHDLPPMQLINLRLLPLVQGFLSG